MIDQFAWPQVVDASDEKLVSDVRTFGWHIVGINEEPGLLPYCFSVGLYLNYGHPEIVLFGLPHPAAQGLINNVGFLVREGREFTPGIRYPDIAVGYDSMFRPVSISEYEEFLGYAIWFYRSLPRPFPTLQLVWPDKANVFPWEDGFDENFRELQWILDPE